MKILYVITKSNWGGAQKHVFDLATTMKAKGHDVWVALGGEGILKKRLEDAGVYTFGIASLNRDFNLKNDTISFKEIFTVIKNKRPDIIHLHSPKAAGLGALSGRILNVKHIIMTVHGWSFNENRPIWERLMIALFSWISMILCHTTILLSDREYEQARHFPWIKDKIKLLLPGIKMPVLMSIDGAKQTISKMIAMPMTDFSKKIILGTIAELHPNKGLNYLIEAVATIVESNPNVISIVIGTGQEESSLRQKIKKLHLENNFFLVGYLEDAVEYIKAFTLFVLPSLKEGLPYAILEAGCASLGVVTTTVGGIPEIVEDMKSGILVQPKNSRELTHAISFMIEHPDERKKYGIALKERVTSKYAFDRMIWLIEGVYRERL
ncbi:MAG: glycosyltransferase family 4 protein [Candidatus Paceibacterota bacterium]|jgi:glycosyltransferase involved in cell wall biosynthesis